MTACESRTQVMSSLCGVVATQLKDLLGLFFRTLPELLGLPASFLLKKIQKAGHLHPPLMELEAVTATLPELPHDVMMNIFATLEIPDLVRAEKVYRQQPELLALHDLREELYYKAFVFPDPSTASYIVVLIHAPFNQISFARARDDKWTWLPHSTGYRDCLYMDGLLYALKETGQIDAFDLAASTVTRTVIFGKLKPGRFKSIYIIQAPWGDLLQIWRTVDVAHGEEHLDGGFAEWEDEYGGSPKVRTLKITVYKVDMDAKKLVEMKGLPYHMLFLGHNKSLCLSAEGHPKLKSNHAYFTEDYEELTVYSKNVSRDIGVWDLENCRKKKIVSQIWSNWPCPTWLTPSIVKMNLAFRK
ncbi:hypothetical protein HU200_027903 [Digitaria exilis]|uniref:F-box domain-containing protein n=1 Tax=Digitaria exilis TaxID=1010633 RepID=A0A835EQB7_9POAL|nr:hypothetical protein HU200_027903 [Digitaria exilis]